MRDANREHHTPLEARLERSRAAGLTQEALAYRVGLSAKAASAWDAVSAGVSILRLGRRSRARPTVAFGASGAIPTAGLAVVPRWRTCVEENAFRSLDRWDPELLRRRPARNPGRRGPR